MAGGRSRRGGLWPPWLALVLAGGCGVGVVGRSSASASRCALTVLVPLAAWRFGAVHHGAIVGRAAVLAGDDDEVAVLAGVVVVVDAEVG